MGCVWVRMGCVSPSHYWRAAGQQHYAVFCECSLMSPVHTLQLTRLSLWACQVYRVQLFEKEDQAPRVGLLGEFMTTHSQMLNGADGTEKRSDPSLL